MKRSRSAPWCCVPAVLCGLPSLAATLNVPADHPTIQAAVTAAAPGDTVLVASGTYSGPGNRDLDFTGKAIVVTGAGGAAATIIDCGAAGRGFIFQSAETSSSVVSALTIRNGAMPAANGGGIFCTPGSTPTIADCIITENTAENGGGVYGPAILVGCTISRNSTTDLGGGGVFGAQSLTNCAVVDNRGEDDGGGVYAGAATALTNCTITGNRASGGCGGGIFSIFGFVTAVNCVISENSALNCGGGVQGEGDFLNCFIQSNTAEEGNGGGLDLRGGSLTNCVITGNTAMDGDGGGVEAGANPVTLMNCTISGNSISGTGDGGGVHCDSPAPTVTNSIVWGNAPDELSGCAPCSFCITAVDPLFVGGGDFHLQPGSPAIDAGTALGAPPTDIDGLLRPCGSGIDIGAYEHCVALLWPPNHKFALTAVLGVAAPDGGPATVTVTGVTQDEPVKATGRGSGMTCPDAVLVDTDGDGAADAAAVRRERGGSGNGRVYRIHFVAAGEDGAECGGSIAVCVPHAPKTPCRDDGQLHDSTVCPGGGAPQEAAGAGLRVFTPEEVEALAPEPLFLRGDVNFDEEGDLSDAVSILAGLFLAREPFPCADAADANDDGEIDLSDAVALLSHLFTGGFTVRDPIARIGPDPTPDPLGCD